MSYSTPTTRWNRLSVAVIALAATSFAGCPASDRSAVDKPSGDEPPSLTGSPTPSTSAAPVSAREVLQSMVAAYKSASSYADSGTVRLRADHAQGKIDESADFSVTLERPNRLRLHMYQAMAVCDGKQLYAAIEELPGQVLVREAPAELTINAIYKDRMLAAALAGGFAGASPQLMMLLADDPLKLLLHGEQEVKLGQPGPIDNHDCYRVEITRRDGTTVFWVDQKSHALRRVEFPVDELQQILARGGQVKDVSLVADFVGAQLGGSVDATAFQFEIPAGAKQVKFFVPPDPAQLLGQKVPDFRFVDLEGKPVTPESLAGKITVLDFWATWCRPCQITLPELNKVYEQFKDDSAVAMIAVSVDEPQTTGEDLVATFKELGVGVPIARDPQQHGSLLLRTTTIPAMFIIDGRGIVQDYETGANPQLADVLAEKLRRLLGGKDIFHEPLAEYQRRLEDYARSLEAAESETGEGSMAEQQEIPQAKIATPSEPQTFKLKSLWKSAELKAPGNLLVVDRPDGPPRLLVVDAWKSIAEVDLDGKLLATHKLDIEPMEVVSSLRTAVDGQGKRYIAALASAQQRFHLFDGNFDRVFSFPEDALENPHQGIADVQLGDLDGDGTLAAYVGYWGVVGVQRVALDGERIWANRTLANVVKMAVGGPDAQGHRLLFCTNNSGALIEIDGQGKRQGEVTVGDRPIYWITAADLLGDGQLQWCGLAAPKLGENVAIGLNLEGKELWQFTLPLGVQPQPIEPVIVGRLAPEPGRQWLLPGPDGSIHILASDGQPLDQFNYGAPLGGLATIEHDDRRILIVASSRGLEAWLIE